MGLVRQLLVFGRPRSVERHQLDLGPLIDEVAALLRATLPSTIELVTSVNPETPSVSASTTELHQVLVNLCTNARDGLGDRPGRIVVTLAPAMLDETTGPQVGLSPGSFACLSVSDDGNGIEAAVLDRIFDPFYTTKTPGKGTGLGLSVVHGIVKAHEGAVRVASAPGVGATFTLYFPASPAPAAAVTEPDRPPTAPGHAVLLVDDDDAHRSVATRMMERLGYRVTSIGHPHLALKVFRDAPDRFDLVITDLTMPDATGLELAAELLALRPELTIVLSSGTIDEDVERAAREVGIRRILRKPFTLEACRQALR